MIEREAGVPGDRRLVAAVVYNRLHDGMPLGIDATIRFANDNYSEPLSESELSADSPYNSMKDLLDAIRTKPAGTFSFSGSGIGTVWDLARIGMLNKVGIDPKRVKYIPTNGAAPAITEMLGGHIDVITCSYPEVAPQVKAGKLKTIGIMAGARNPQFSDIPTLKEEGIDWSYGTWRGFAVPLKTPKDRVEYLQQAILKIADYLILVALALSIFVIAAALILVCAGFFSIHAAAMGSLNRNLTASRGRANSLYVLAYYLGGAIGITLNGYAYEAAGWHGVVGLWGVAPGERAGGLQALVGLGRGRDRGGGSRARCCRQALRTRHAAHRRRAVGDDPRRRAQADHRRRG